MHPLNRTFTSKVRMIFNLSRNFPNQSLSLKLQRESAILTSHAKFSHSQDRIPSTDYLRENNLTMWRKSTTTRSTRPPLWRSARQVGLTSRTILYQHWYSNQVFDWRQKYHHAGDIQGWSILHNVKRRKKLINDQAEEVCFTTRFLPLSSNRLHSKSKQELENNRVKEGDKYPWIIISALRFL